MKKVLVSAAAFLALGMSAKAADLGVPRSAVAGTVVSPAAFTWTGFYLGAHLGYGWGNSSFPLDATLQQAGIPFSLGHRYQGIVAGGQFGFNYQINQIVLGLEGTLAYAGLSGSRDLAGGLLAPTTLALQTKNTWLATMGPRLGFAFDRAMIYAKGGFAAGGFNSGIVITNPGLDLRGSFARGGWFVGAGVEYAVSPNWSVKLEYNYIAFGRGNYIAAQAPAGTPLIGGANIGLPASLNTHTVTLGVNYLFNTGPGAVVARY